MPDPHPPARPAHLPVMADQVAELLALPAAASGVLVDATVGAGGHAAALLAASAPSVHLVGFDRDPDALTLAKRRLAAYGGRVTLVHAGYEDLATHVLPVRDATGPVQGVLYDLGVSSLQLDRPQRGFSFRADGPLDMRMDPSQGRTAAELVNTLDAPELERILRSYGEERRARRIAAAVVAARPLTTTTQLADVVAASVPAAVRHAAPHPATRTFQALRIAVNDELEHFRASLPQALELLAPAAVLGDTTGRGGRLVTLAYHSLEDRIAKQFLAAAATGCICPPDLPVCGCGRVPTVRLLTRGAARPSGAEVAANPRARSARLRAAERLPVAPPSEIHRNRPSGRQDDAFAGLPDDEE